MAEVVSSRGPWPRAVEGAADESSSTRAPHLQSLREITNLVNAGRDLGTVFERIVFAVCHHTSWTRSGIMAVDAKSGYSVLVTRHEAEADNEAELPRQWELDTSPTLKVVETRQPIIIEDAQVSEQFPGYRADSIARGYHTVVVLPLEHSDMQGREMVLSVSSDERVSVTAEELDFLATVSHLAGLAVDKAKSLHAERMLTARLERALGVNANLLERVLQGSSMEMIAGIVETVLPDPIVIVDLTTDGFHVGRSPDADRFSDREWAELVCGPAARNIRHLVQQSEPSDFRRLQRIDLRSTGAPFERDAYVEPLQLDRETVGGLIIFPRQRGLDDLDVLIAMEVKFALSVQLMRTHVHQQSADFLLSELFTRLFEGDWPDARQIVNRAARLGIDVTKPALLVGIGLRDETRQALKADAGHLLRQVRRWLQKSCPGAVVINHGAALMVYLPDPAHDADTLAASLGGPLLDIVKWHCEAAPIIAMGPVCTRLEDYPPAREQCSRLLTLARIFGRHGVVRQSDFGPFAVLMSALDQSVALEFVEATLGELEAYDRDNGTELLRTAAVFIDQGCRYQATAEVLEIHVSTLRYRLQRLHKLFDLDADDPETRFALSLALRLRSVLGASTN